MVFSAKMQLGEIIFKAHNGLKLKNKIISSKWQTFNPLMSSNLFSSRLPKLSQVLLKANLISLKKEERNSMMTDFLQTIILWQANGETLKSGKRLNGKS